MTHHSPIEIFRAGRHVAMSGHAFDFSESDLDAAAQAYDPALSEAPIVVGHPATDAPAYGWVSKLNSASGVLQAVPHQVDPEFAELVNAKRYKKVSASFYLPGAANNPAPGVYYLRHVGFLGAQPPAVKGLRDAAFATGDDFVTIEFSEQDPAEGEPMTKTDDAAFAEEVKRLAEEQAEVSRRMQELETLEAAFAEREKVLRDAEEQARQKSLAEFADAMIKQGRLLPRDRADVVQFMVRLDGSDSIEFGEGDGKTTKTALAWFQEFAAQLPVRIHFGEVGDAPGPDPLPPLHEVHRAMLAEYRGNSTN